MGGCPGSRDAVMAGGKGGCSEGAKCRGWGWWVGGCWPGVIAENWPPAPTDGRGPAWPWLEERPQHVWGARGPVAQALCGRLSTGSWRHSQARSVGTQRASHPSPGLGPGLPAALLPSPSSTAPHPAPCPAPALPPCYAGSGHWGPLVAPSQYYRIGPLLQPFSLASRQSVLGCCPSAHPRVPQWKASASLPQPLAVPIPVVHSAGAGHQLGGLQGKGRGQC